MDFCMNCIEYCMRLVAEAFCVLSVLFLHIYPWGSGFQRHTCTSCILANSIVMDGFWEHPGYVNYQ